MAKQPTEEELNIRRKARRRLVGAIALTLAVVVVLPMVLDSEPKPNTQNIELRIPSPDKVGEFVPGVAASAVAEALPPDTHVAVAGSAPVAAPAAAVVQASAAKPMAAAPVVPVPGKSPEAPDKAKTEAPVKAQAATNKSPEAKAADSIAVKSGSKDKPADAAAENYVAQVGAYSNPATAKQELDKLKAWGFKAYTEKVGDKVRVRVGPYAEREKAEKVRQLLEKHGLHPVVMGSQ